MYTSKSLCLSVLLLLASQAQADEPVIVPVEHSFHGMTYAQWGAEWWKWAYGAPASTNPVLDTTGEFADVDQSGAVWFLAGSFGETLSRTVTIPADKFLFFPIVNSAWVGPPTMKIGRHHVESFVGDVLAVGDYWCEIDGVAVPDLASYWVTMAAGEGYYIKLTDDNLFGVRAGRYGPTVDSGVYLMLRPLSPGEHTIHIRTEFGAESIDVTYQLTVG